MNVRTFVKLIAGMLLGFSLCTTGTASANKSQAFWKYETSGDFAVVLENLKSGLEAAQFMITDEENLSRGLENNKHLLGGDAKWNTIGFDQVTSLNFCSIVFNHEAFNTDMSLSILCPFKLVIYNMKKSPEKITIITVRPTYLLKRDKAKNQRIGKKVEERIIKAITDGVKLKM